MLKLIALSSLFILVSCSNVRPLGIGQGRSYKVVFVKPGQNNQNNEEQEKVRISKEAEESLEDAIAKNEKRRESEEVVSKLPQISVVKHRQSSIRRNKPSKKYRKSKKSRRLKRKRKSKSRRENPVTAQTYQFGNQTMEFPRDLFDHWVDYFSKRSRSRFLRFYKNGSNVKNIVSKVMKKHNLPEELFFVGFIESGYNFSAKSHADAVGPWQFIKSTAKRYGLRVDRSVDERMNIYKATEAAAKYFKDLYNIFGSWELALSAYNAGEYRVINAIRDGKTRNFRELVRRKLLPKETIYYVPKVMAAKHLHERGEYYGILFPKKPKSIFNNVHKTNIRYPFSLKAIADRTKIPYSLLKKLNADVKHKWTHVSKKRPHALYIPRGIGQGKIYSRLTRKNARLDSSMQKYTVQSGDSLLGIAYKFDVGLSQLKAANGLKSNRIKRGQKLVIPTSKTTSKVHVVKSGESVFRIAKMYDVPLSEILHANRLKNGKIYPGQKLVVPVDI